MNKKYNLKTRHFFYRIILPVFVLVTVPVVVFVYTEPMKFLLKNSQLYSELIKILNMLAENYICAALTFLIISILPRALSAILFSIIVKLFRMWNKKRAFNYSNQYIEYPNFIFFLSKLLGYNSIDVRYVPIYTHFYLVNKKIYSEITFVNNNSNVEDIIPKKDCDVAIEKCFVCEEKNFINIIIEDSFQIDYKVKALLMKDNNYVYIARNRYFYHGREFCLDFANSICECIHELRKHYKELRLFTTTNPRHNNHIFQNISTPNNRDPGVTLKIYQSHPNSDEIHDYDNNNYKVFNL